jgi:cell division protein ZapA
MKNKVTVSIAHREYTLLSDENEAYVQKVAGYVTSQIDENMKATGISAVDAAVLAAANITDNYFQEMESTERLRRQLKEALDDAAQIKSELSEAKREIFRLSNGKK